MKKIPGKLFPKTLCDVIVIAIVLFFTAAQPVFAQPTFGKVAITDFNLPMSNAVDSNANAVIISDVGNTSFIGNTHNWVSYVFKKTTRIKILNKKAANLTVVKIYLRGKDDWQEQIDNLKAATYNVENGKVVATSIKSEDVFEEKLNKNIIEKKFTFPNVKDGCIIEYTYSITSRYFRDLPEWQFQQNAYPCLYSEFEIAIPDLLGYLTIRQGVDSFSTFRKEDGYETLMMQSVKVGSVIHKSKWIMKDIAPLKHEDYVNFDDDYLDKVSFALSQTYNGQDVKDKATGWKAANLDLMRDPNFGAAFDLDNAASLKNTADKICGEETNLKEVSKKIFTYVRDNFTCKPNNSIYTYKNLYDVNQNKYGSVADINLLLIALLKQRGLKAYPIILSTQDYGTNPPSYPILDKMNYVVCMLKLFGDSIYLDASNPLIGYGKLPLKCYNGHARVIDENDGGSIYLYPDALKEQEMTSFFITNDEKTNALSAGVQSNLGYYESYKLRKQLKEIGEKEYLKRMQTNYGTDYKIDNLQIDAVNKLDEPISINYDLSFNANNGADIIYFNPILTSQFKENPFKSATRKYPIEMPYPIDDMYVLNMEIPKGYTVDELPKSAKIALNTNDGIYEYIITKDATNVQLRSHVKLNQAEFDAEDYTQLRNFFAYIVKKQSEQIVFKKIK